MEKKKGERTRNKKERRKKKQSKRKKKKQRRSKQTKEKKENFSVAFATSFWLLFASFFLSFFLTFFLSFFPSFFLSLFLSFSLSFLSSFFLFLRFSRRSTDGRPKKEGKKKSCVKANCDDVRCCFFLFLSLSAHTCVEKDTKYNTSKIIFNFLIFFSPPKKERLLFSGKKSGEIFSLAPLIRPFAPFYLRRPGRLSGSLSLLERRKQAFKKAFEERKRKREREKEKEKRRKRKRENEREEKRE